MIETDSHEDDGEWSVVSSARTTKTCDSFSVVSKDLDASDAMSWSMCETRTDSGFTTTTTVSDLRESAATMLLDASQSGENFDNVSKMERFASQKRAIWKGRSVKKKCKCCHTKNSLDEMSVNRKLGAITEVDEFLEIQDCKISLMQQTSVGLKLGGRWEVKELLAEKAVRIRKVYNKFSGVMEITYDVPVVGHVHGDAIREMQMKRFKQRLFQNTIHKLVWATSVDQIKVREIGSYPLHPPECKFPELKMVLRAPRGCASGINNARKAKCRNMGCRSYFAPDKGMQSHQYLEVDFGEVCLIKAASVSGRTIATTRFPTGEFLHGHGFKGAYRGPHWMIVNERQCNPIAQYFFDSFILDYRVEKGADWINLGRFRGPPDNFAERLQPLDNVENMNDPHGVRARFLRFRVGEGEVLTKEKGLRVAIFGEAAPKELVPSGAAHHDDEEEEIVSYTVRENSKQVENTTPKIGNSYRWERYSEKHFRTRSRKRLQDAVSDAIEDYFELYSK